METSMNVIQIITGYVIGLNLLGFAIMGIDKYKAKKGLWRIPEATLFIIALIGGLLRDKQMRHTFSRISKARILRLFLTQGGKLL